MPGHQQKVIRPSRQNEGWEFLFAPRDLLKQLWYTAMWCNVFLTEPGFYKHSSFAIWVVDDDELVKHDIVTFTGYPSWVIQAYLSRAKSFCWSQRPFVHGWNHMCQDESTHIFCHLLVSLFCLSQTVNKAFWRLRYFFLLTFSLKSPNITSVLEWSPKEVQNMKSKIICVSLLSS